MALVRGVCENRRVDAYDLYGISSNKGVKVKGVENCRLGRRNTIAVEDIMRQSRGHSNNDGQ